MKKEKAVFIQVRNAPCVFKVEKFKLAHFPIYLWPISRRDFMFSAKTYRKHGISSGCESWETNLIIWLRRWMRHENAWLRAFVYWLIFPNLSGTIHCISYMIFLIVLLISKCESIKGFLLDSGGHRSVNSSYFLHCFRSSCSRQAFRFARRWFSVRKRIDDVQWRRRR